MTALAPTLQAFFTERLLHQRRASTDTIASYRDAFRLLLTFLNEHAGTEPSRLRLEDLDADAISAFLTHLEVDRGNSVRTRNTRLAAVRSFFRFAALRHPEHAALIQRALAIPRKRASTGALPFLTTAEVDAVLATPDRRTRNGRRDYTLLLLAVQTGLRVSELTGLRCGDLELGTGANVRVHGKGRKDRCTPLTATTTSALAAWFRERSGTPDDRLFPGRGNGRLSSDAVQRMIAKHTSAAAPSCTTLRAKTVTPHVLRHTTVISPALTG